MNADLLLFGLVGQLSVWQYLVIGFVSVTALAILPVTLYLHRAMAHRAVVFHPVIAHLMRLSLWLVTGMVTREWVAIHRKHHVYSDRPGDPHSSWVKGFFAIFPFGFLEYVREVRFMRAALIRHRQTGEFMSELDYYGKQGTPDDWLERALYSKHPARGVLIGALLALALFGFGPGLLLVVMHAIWIPFWAAAVINGVGHAFGYRTYETKERSTNIGPFGLLIGGEELHNNHHANPASPKFSHRWFEIDLGWGVICFLSWLGLASYAPSRLPPRFSIDPTRTKPDEETLRAVIAGRFRWLRQLEIIRKRESQAIPDWSAVLESFESLWQDRDSGESELVVRLQNWHAQAIISGSWLLGRFARQVAATRLKEPRRA